MDDFQYLSYEIKDNIHIIKFRRTVNPAVDEYIQVFRHLCENYGSDESIKLLVDSSQGTLSMRYTMRKIREVIDDYPKRPHFNTALVVQDTLVYRMLEFTLRTIAQNDNVKLSTDADEALTWLQEQVISDKEIDSSQDDTESDL